MFNLIHRLIQKFRRTPPPAPSGAAGWGGHTPPPAPTAAPTAPGAGHTAPTAAPDGPVAATDPGPRRVRGGGRGCRAPHYQESIADMMFRLMGTRRSP